MLLIVEATFLEATISDQNFSCSNLCRRFSQSLFFTLTRVQAYDLAVHSLQAVAKDAKYACVSPAAV